VPRNLKRYYGAGDFHFLTFSCHRRLPFLRRAWRRDLFLRALEQVSVALKALKQAVARRLLGSARRRKQDASQLALFRADELPQRFWQRRFYDFNVFTEKKRLEKLRYMHRNPVKRGLVENPEDWRWSSFRQYAFGEKGLVEINAVFPPEWAARKG
jgi:putative transposase